MSDGPCRRNTDIHPASPADLHLGISRRTFLGGAGAAAALAALGVPPWLSRPAFGQSPPPSGPLRYIGKQSMNPPAWPNTAPGWTNTTTTPLPPSGGFSPIRLTTNNGTASSPTPGFTEPVAVGDPLTFRIKVAPGATPGGVRINYTTSGTTWSPCYCPDLTVANPQWNMWNSASTSTVLVSSVKLADGTTEAVFRTIVQDSTLQIGLSTSTDTEGHQVDIWGLQVVRGDLEPWQPVGNSSVVFGTVGGGGLGFIGKQSMNPTSWPNPAPGWTDTTTTPLSPSGGFSPIRLTTNNGTASSPTPGLTEPLSVGDHLTFRIKVAPGVTPGGVRINYTTSGTTWEPCNCPDLTVDNPQWNMWNSASTSTVLVSSTKLADGTTEAVFRTIVQDPTLQIGLSTSTDTEGKQVDIWGLQVLRGDVDGWLPVGDTTIAIGSVDLDFVAGNYQGGSLADLSLVGAASDELNDDGSTTHFNANTVRRTDLGVWVHADDDLAVVAGSQLEGLLLGAQGFCGLELQALAHSTIGTVGWTGSTQGTLLRVGSQDVLKPQGPTGFQTLAGTGALGLSGWRGIVRIAIAWDANGFSVFANGSKLQAGGAGVFSPAGTVKLLAGILGRLRRISAGASRLADADLQGWTELQNKTFLRPKNALVLGAVAQTYNDDYDGALNDSLRYQSSRNFPYGDWNALAQSYNSGGPNAIWMPRAPYYTDDPTGMGGNNAFSTQVLLYYVDPREPGNWTGSHVVQSSCMELHLRPISQLTGSEQAKIPINSTTGQPFKYVAGLMTTYGFFAQKFGVFSSRDQMPAFQGSWPAWWLYTTAGGSPAPEFDIEEYYGSDKDTSTDTMHDSVTNDYLNHDVGYDLSADFHDRTCVWTSATLDKYLDGELLGHHVPTAEVNNATMFLLYNFGLDSGIYQGDPDTENTATDAALANNPNPALRIDRTTVFQFA